MPDEPDYEIARRFARVTDGKPIVPKHIRMLGGGCFGVAAVFVGLNLSAWQRGEVWPKALVMVPPLVLLGLWFLIDATALAGGTRRHQKAILWALVAAGTAVGLFALYSLTDVFG